MSALPRTGRVRLDLMDSRMPRISLVVATVGRTAELARFLVHLSAQSYRDVELIIVDQNPDERLQPILTPYRSRFQVAHLRSERGVSRARNLGLKRISGDIVAFPDDDCWYGDAELLARVAAFLASHPQWDGLNAIARDEDGMPIDPRAGSQAARLTRRNVCFSWMTYAFFLTRRVIEKVGGFDETLGPGSGSILGAGEDADYLLRSIGAGFAIRYEPSLAVNHPSDRPRFDSAGLARAFSYSAGLYGVLRLHGYPMRSVAWPMARTTFGLGLALLSGDIATARYRLAALRGRIRGWQSARELRSP